ncbi:MAG TPA: type II toxin-antitoxin system ParD family antitoxin [Pyrinomonadaceae bacterium]|nr:type II toxin-antitoxin system ParD family antitoxin [Pyrinomonadaceae bacterium]
MNISLPQELRTFVDSQVSEGDYTSSSEYVRELLRNERERVRIQRLLRDGAASPVSDTVWDAKYFEKMRASVKAKAK